MKLDKITTSNREWIEKMYTSTESWGKKFRNPGDEESRGWEGAASEVRGEEKERKGIRKGVGGMYPGSWMKKVVLEKK